MVIENRPPNEEDEGSGEILPPVELSKFTAKVMTLTGLLQTFTDADLSKVKDKLEMKRALIDQISEGKQILSQLDQIEFDVVKKRFRRIFKEAKHKLTELEQDEKKN